MIEPSFNDRSPRRAASPNRWLPGACAALPAAALLALSGCTHTVKVEPIRVEPIFITLDVRLTVDRELDRFFDFEDEQPAPGQPDAATSKGGST